MLRIIYGAFALLLIVGFAGGPSHAEEPTSLDRFDGGYVGAQVGLGTAGSDLAIAGVPVFDSNFSGGVAGLYGGYGWQRGRRYFGVEFSGGYSGVKDGNLLPVGGTPWVSGEVERVYGFALLGKAGKVIGEEKDALVYGLLGPSVVRVEANATLMGLGTISDGAAYPGLSIGLGVEHFFNDRLSARVQGVFTKYYDVGSLIEGVTNEKYDSQSAVIQFGVTRWLGR